MRLSGYQLQNLSKKEFIDSLSSEVNNYKIESAQIASWEESFEIFYCLTKSSHFSQVEFIFEYEIPYSDGKRPDILMFINKTIFVIEYKNRSYYKEKEDFKQLRDYVTFLKYYHSAGSEFVFKPILLLTAGKIFSDNESNGSVCVVSKNIFLEKWYSVSGKRTLRSNNVELFLNGVYKPNLEITKYAESIYIEDYLDGIESPIFEETQKALVKIENIIDRSRGHNIHSIVFILGEAGSGKTALALKICKMYKGCLISKNKKFITLLEARLGHKVNIHPSTAVTREFFSNRNMVSNNITIIDEAQRAWGKGRIREYYGETMTEHEIFLSHLKNINTWSTTIIFIGNNQQLASSETSYFNTWIDAINELNIKEKKIEIYKPNEIEIESSYITHRVDEFILQKCIRNNMEGQYAKMINDIIDLTNLKYLRTTVQDYINKGLKLYITRDLNKCIEYFNSNEHNQKLSTVLLGTPSNIDDEFLGVMIDYQKANNVNLNELLCSQRIKSYDFLCNNALTQFQVLGLEFDLPIIQWNMDYLFYYDKWNYDFLRRIEGYGMFYIKNAYRVLLTRGRYGMVLYFPKNWQLNETYLLFKKIGFEEISKKTFTMKTQRDYI
jgi:hypothetical protein